MATFGLNWTVENTTGNVGYKVYWRLSGTSLWTTAMTSGTTYSVGPGEDNNSIYDFQIQNINNDDNPTCAIFQAIGFTDPEPTFSVSNDSISFEFEKPTDYITSYTATIALFNNPGDILQTIEIPLPGDTVTGTFTGLSPATSYVIALLVAANEFTYTFNYNKITTNLSSCYPPTNVSAMLTSGTHMTIMWTAPVIMPSNGFIGSYRRKAVTTPYTTFVTSGTTSGNTYSVSVEAPASYSGFVESDCDSILSEPVPFGVNGYAPLNFSISDTYILTVSSLYSNPYDIIIAGSYTAIVSDVPLTDTFEVTYVAGSTEESFELCLVCSEPTSISVVIDTISPQFNNGGQLQQLDTVLTPDYFQFYNGLSSGVTWDGNPATLPSFTLDNFIPTEQDTEGNITKGILNYSWIYDSVYMDGVSPYTFGTFRVIDIGDSAVIGTTTFSINPIGERSGSIVITKSSTDITPENLFRLRFIWANGSVGGNSDFYLPEF